MNWTLDVSKDRFEVSDTDALRRQLLQLHETAKQAPVVAVLNAPDGSSLAIGLGRELSVLDYIAPGGWPAKHVVGSQANEGLVSYMAFGQYSEMPASHAIPISEAIDAAVEFFLSGKPTDTLQWAND